MKSLPRSLSRLAVQVVFRINKSISFAAKASNLADAVKGTYSTLDASPKIAAATALQKSISNPSNCPAELTTPNPVRLSLTPHFNTPRSMTVWRVFELETTAVSLEDESSSEHAASKNTAKIDMATATKVIR